MALTYKDYAYQTGGWNPDKNWDPADVGARAYDPWAGKSGADTFFLNAMAGAGNNDQSFRWDDFENKLGFNRAAYQDANQSGFDQWVKANSRNNDDDANLTWNNYLVEQNPTFDIDTSNPIAAWDLVGGDTGTSPALAEFGQGYARYADPQNYAKYDGSDHDYMNNVVSKTNPELYGKYTESLNEYDFSGDDWFSNMFPALMLAAVTMGSGGFGMFGGTAAGAGTQAGMLAAQEAGLGPALAGWGGATTAGQVAAGVGAGGFNLAAGASPGYQAAFNASLPWGQAATAGVGAGAGASGFDFGSPSDWGGSPNGSFEYTGSGDNMDWGDLFQADQDYFDNFQFPSNADVAPNFDWGGFSAEDLSNFDNFQFPSNADVASNSTGWFDTLKNAVNNPLKAIEEAVGLPSGSINTAQKAYSILSSLGGGQGGGQGGGITGALSSLFGGGQGGTDWASLLGSGASAILTNSQKQALEGATTTATDMADPFAKERPQYQGQLKNLMTNPAALEGNAAFQNMFNTGLEAVNRTASAKGQLQSGNRLTDLMDYGQKKASEFYFPQAQLLSGLAGANAGSPASAGQFKLEGTAAAQGLRSKQAGDLLYGVQPQQNQNQTLKQLLSQWG